jgi:hypothetical protein
VVCNTAVRSIIEQIQLFGKLQLCGNVFIGLQGLRQGGFPEKSKRKNLQQSAERSIGMKFF